MGSLPNRQNLRRNHDGVRSSGQTRRRVGAALACASLIAGALGQTPPAPAPTFDAQKAWQHLLWQVEIGPRNPGSEGHRKARERLLAEMSKLTDNARYQPFSHVWSRTGQPVQMFNLIGEQNWKDAQIRIVLLAHWDTRPSAEQDPDPAKRNLPIPGANDGASGVAVLLELMRVFKDLKGPIGIQYLLTDGEDLGPGLDEMFLGASAYAKSPGSPRPDYGILLDMIGDKNLEVPMEPNSYYYAKDLMVALYGHAQQIGLGATFPLKFGPEIWDDHLPLNQVGIPTIDLIDFTYPSWHTQADTVDKCSPESLGKVGKLLESWIRRPTPWRPKKTG